MKHLYISLFAALVAACSTPPLPAVGGVGAEIEVEGTADVGSVDAVEIKTETETEIEIEIAPDTFDVFEAEAEVEIAAEATVAVDTTEVEAGEDMAEDAVFDVVEVEEIDMSSEVTETAVDTVEPEIKTEIETEIAPDTVDVIDAVEAIDLVEETLPPTDLPPLDVPVEATEDVGVDNDIEVADDGVVDVFEVDVFEVEEVLLPLCVTADCEDNNLCTDDVCDPTKGCQNTNNTLPCNDGNACTLVDVCEAGACMGTESNACSDDNICTNDSCDMAEGCQHVVAVNCDDGNSCTDDVCDPAKGCQNKPNSAACNDGNECTSSDTCSSSACSGQAVTCEDNNLCTTDSCDATKGCVFVAKQPEVNETFEWCTDGASCAVKSPWEVVSGTWEVDGVENPGRNKAFGKAALRFTNYEEGKDQALIRMPLKLLPGQVVVIDAQRTAATSYLFLNKAEVALKNKGVSVVEAALITADDNDTPMFYRRTKLVLAAEVDEVVLSAFSQKAVVGYWYQVFAWKPELAGCPDP